MTKSSRILVGVAVAVSAGVIISYLLRTEKGNEVSRQIKDVAGSLLEKGKEMLSKAKDEAQSRVSEITV
ncbi:YtxH domain-containing protein [Lacibacter sp. H375]|uniref:YtxH domain-containing protein n=1 Tax=Lacibacter sp. H375 TaxID=3133424 RepID=UPI0030C046BA